MPSALSLFLLGASAALLGDHFHVVTGTTEYFAAAHAVPFVWSSPIWFPAAVGLTTVLLAEIRLHLPAPRTDVTFRQGVAGVAAVIGTYAFTALLHASPAVPVTALICVLAVIIWCALGDRAAALCGVLVAVGGPAVEAVLAAIGVFRYTPGSDGLFGVGPWLPPLYFAFGVVTALLGELFAAHQKAGVDAQSATLIDAA